MAESSGVTGPGLIPSSARIKKQGAGNESISRRGDAPGGSDADVTLDGRCISDRDVGLRNRVTVAALPAQSEKRVMIWSSRAEGYAAGECRKSGRRTKRENQRYYPN